MRSLIERPKYNSDYDDLMQILSFQNGSQKLVVNL